ncbi:hypothetical protein FA13DRAFT_1816410, partial [Coprinellus micaceus]
MGLDGPRDAEYLLESIPKGLKCLYWKHVGESISLFPPSVDLPNICQFLEKQTSIKTMSFPFSIRTWPIPSFGVPYSARDWILQEQSHVVAFNLFKHKNLLPNMRSRSISYQLAPGGIDMVLLASGALRETDPGSALSLIDSLEKNPTITRFSLVENLEKPLPLHSLAHKLRIIRQQSPNVSQLDLTLLSDTLDHFGAAFYCSTHPVPLLPGVTTLSLQRVFAASQLLDPV